MRTARAMLAATVVAAVAVVAPAAAAPSAKNENIAQIASSSPQFSTLASLLKKAGLVGALKSGNFTVFAPTNAAFAKVPKATLAALAANPDQLRAVLTYHVAKGRLTARKVVRRTRIRTVNGASIRVSVRRGNVYLNRTTRVTKTNIRASNGVVHVINRVLLPPAH